MRQSKDSTVEWNELYYEFFGLIGFIPQYGIVIWYSIYQHLNAFTQYMCLFLCSIVCVSVWFCHFSFNRPWPVHACLTLTAVIETVMHKIACLWLICISVAFSMYIYTECACNSLWCIQTNTVVHFSRRYENEHKEKFRPNLIEEENFYPPFRYIVMTKHKCVRQNPVSNSRGNTC